MDKRRQSILKGEGRIPLQESIPPDFPEEDTATVTVTKSRRVSFGANFVKEFIIGSAVSAQFLSEYEQAVSSSDSSNQNTSRSGILDQSTFHKEEGDDSVDDDALNLCTKRCVEEEFDPLKRKYCHEKLNSYAESNDINNENVWDFNVGMGSNIFTEKNACHLNKGDLSRNTVSNNRKSSHLNDSSVMDKQFQNKRNESELNSSKMEESLGKKAKIGKFSSTIFFSADSPTADVEFTEGCISLAKSIFDKKKKEMTVYIKGTPKDCKKEDGRDGSNTVVFESDDSDVGMKLTRCVDGTESNTSPGNFSKYFPDPNDSTRFADDFDESHENIENIPFHTYSLNMMLGRDENSRTDAELERSLFYPERSLTEMLRSDPYKTTVSDNFPEENDNTDECDMDISSPRVFKTTVLDEGVDGNKEVVSPSKPLWESPYSIGCTPADEEESECTSPVFTNDADSDVHLSLTGEDNADTPPNGNSHLNSLSDCTPLKIVTSSAANGFMINEQGQTTDGETVSPSVEVLNCSASKEGDCSEGRHSTRDNAEDKSGLNNLLTFPASFDGVSSQEGDAVADANNKSSSSREDEEGSSDVVPAGHLPSRKGEEEKDVNEANNCGALPNDERDACDFDVEMNFVKEKCSTKFDNERIMESDHVEIGDVVGPKDVLDALDVRLSCENSFSIDRSLPGEGDRTSLGDRRILNLLSEQSEESNCSWTIDSVDHAEDVSVWRFSIPIANGCAVMKFKVRPPKDKSLFSFSVLLDAGLELEESGVCQLEKERIAVEYAFGKLKNYFHSESRGLDNVHRLPIFLDKVNLMMRKLNDILGQVIRILREYPGSLLEESVLSFRIYSFPLLFSCLIAVDISDPFHLSENCVSVKKQFGDFNTNRVKSMFADCLELEEPLVCYIVKLTETVVRMEREIGFITKRSHIRLIS